MILDLVNALLHWWYNIYRKCTLWTGGQLATTSAPKTCVSESQALSNVVQSCCKNPDRWYRMLIYMHRKRCVLVLLRNFKEFCCVWSSIGRWREFGVFNIASIPWTFLNCRCPLLTCILHPHLKSWNMPFALVDFSSWSSSSKSVIHHDQQLSGVGTPRPWPCVVSSCHPMMKRSVLCRASQKQMSVGNIDEVLMGEGGTIFFMLVSERKGPLSHFSRLLWVPIRRGSLTLWFVTLSDLGSFASYFILHLIYWGTRSVDIHEVGLVVFCHFLIIDSQILERQRWKVANLPSLQKGGGVVSKHRWFGVIFKQQALETHIWPTSAPFRAHKGPESFQTPLKKVQGQFQARSHIHMFVPPHAFQFYTHFLQFLPFCLPPMHEMVMVV